MIEPIKLGIIGPGKIATVVVKALEQEPSIKRYAVASTSLERATLFQQTHDFQKAYGSYEEMLQDPDVELVYIATPHSLHYEHMKLCFSYKKAIICEKAFCLTLKDATEIFEESRQKQLFVTEALIPSYLPSTMLIDELLHTNIIGKVKEVYACFGVNLMHVERVINKNLGGGAMYDIGIYPLYFFLKHFGFDSTIIDKQISFHNNVDVEASIKLMNNDHVLGTIETSIQRNLGIYGKIIGTKGIIYIENIARPEWIELRDLENNVLKRIDSLRDTTGYEHEFRASTKAIRNHQIETEEMPHQHSMRLLEMIENIISSPQKT